MAEPEKNEHSEEQFDDLSLEELLRGAREEIARVDAMMGNPADEPVQEPDAADALDAAGEGPADVAADGDAPARTEPKAAMPAFEPQLPDEYADLTVDEEQPDEEAPAHEKFRLPAGVRVFVYVCCVLAASVLLAIGGWRCADDMLALTRENFAVNVTVPENATIAQISTELKDKGLIQYEWLFKFYCWFSKAERKIDPGTYELRGAYDYHALVNGMVRTSGDRATATVMIPEGYECEDIFALLAENGVCAVEELEDAAANHEYDYAFLADLPYGQKNRLEGYLFPDTYEFYVGEFDFEKLDREVDDLLADVKGLLDEPEEDEAELDDPEEDETEPEDAEDDAEAGEAEDAVSDDRTIIFRPLTAYEQSKAEYQTAKRAEYERARAQERQNRLAERQRREAEEDRALRQMEERRKKRRTREALEAGVRRHGRGDRQFF